MSLIVTFFVMALVTQCWTVPQRRNWTPQAILYLKGTQGHRSVFERRERDDSSRLVNLNNDKLSWASTILLQLLQQHVEDDKTLKVDVDEDYTITQTNKS